MWSAAALAFLVRVGAVGHTSMVYMAMGIILAVVQVALPVVCLVLLMKGFGLYAWQVRTQQCFMCQLSQTATSVTCSQVATYTGIFMSGVLPE